MKVSLIILTKNEEGCIGYVLAEVPKKLVQEIVVIDGNSTDNTRKEATAHLRIGFDRFVSQTGAGFGSGIRQAFALVRGDVIIVMCGDGSDDPKYIETFIKRIQEGYEYVRASRYAPGGRSHDDTVITKFGNKLFTFLTNLVQHLTVSDSLYVYSAITRKGLQKFRLHSPGFELTLELLIKAHLSGLKFTSIPVVERKRFSGKKKINSFVDGLKMLPKIFKRYELN